MRKIAKTFLIVALALVMCFSSMPIYAHAMANGASPRFSTLLNSTTAFTTSDSGGTAVVKYDADETNFARIDVNVKLQKKFLLVFWTNVDEWSTSSTNPGGILSHVFTLNGKGTYKATFTVTVTGVDGTVDTFTEEIESKY